MGGPSSLKLQAKEPPKVIPHTRGLTVSQPHLERKGVVAAEQRFFKKFNASLILLLYPSLPRSLLPSILNPFFSSSLAAEHHLPPASLGFAYLISADGVLPATSVPDILLF